MLRWMHQAMLAATECCPGNCHLISKAPRLLGDDWPGNKVGYWYCYYVSSRADKI